MAKYDYEDIDVAGSTSVRPRAINDSGEVVGSYSDVFGKTHGFSAEQGVATTIDVAGATSVTVSDVNASGEIVGTYGSSDPNVGSQAFFETGGSPQSIVIIGAVNVSARSVNDSGQIVGSYTDSKATPSKEFGYLYSNNQVVKIAYPTSDSVGDVALYINNKSQVLGLYETANGQANYYLYNDGDYIPIVVPGAVGVYVEGFNNKGQVVGGFNDGVNQYGFVEDNGVYAKFSVPGAKYLEPTGINAGLFNAVCLV